MNNHIVKFCSEECTRQRSGEMSVSHMYNAWVYMSDVYVLNPNLRFSIECILTLGRLVEPLANFNGFRRDPVIVGGSIRKVVDFPRVLGLLCDSPIVVGPTCDPVEFFRQYEMIHPFIDGNGRTGVILYNALLGTLDDPQDPPDLKDPNFYKGP